MKHTYLYLWYYLRQAQWDIFNSKSRKRQNNRALSWFGTGTSIKVVALSQFLGPQFIHFTNSTYSYNTFSEKIYVMNHICVVVVMLLSCINVSYICPDICECTGTDVDCQDTDLEVIPSGIPAKAESL